MLAKRLKTVRTLWFGLVASVCMFVVALAFEKKPLHAEPFMAPVLALLALGVAVASFVIPANMRKTAYAKVDLPVEEVPDTSTSDVIPDRDAPKRRVFAKPDEALEKAFARYQTPFILSMALSEAVGLFGFMLGRFGFSPLVYGPFFVVSVALMVLRFPTLPKILEPFERAANAKFPLDEL